jgi:hypothetical protein
MGAKKAPAETPKEDGCMLGLTASRYRPKGDVQRAARRIARHFADEALRPPS